MAKFTFRELKQIGIEMWTLLSENPEWGKRKLPEEILQAIYYMQGDCPFCEYYESNCNLCPLKTVHNQRCFNVGSWYNKWKSNIKRDYHAKKIAGAFEQWEDLNEYK